MLFSLHVWLTGAIVQEEQSLLLLTGRLVKEGRWIFMVKYLVEGGIMIEIITVCFISCNYFICFLWTNNEKL